MDHDGVLGWAPASYLEPVDDDSEIVSTQTFAPGKGQFSRTFIILLRTYGTCTCISLEQSTPYIG